MPDKPQRSEAWRELVQFLKLVLSFAPWIAFMVIARDSLWRVKMGLIVGMALAVGLGVAKINRGVILWASLIFFACATVSVAVLENMWTLRYMAVLANGTLAAVTWWTLLIKKPFTLAYAREHADPALWQSPGFIHVNNVITAVWAASLSLNAVVALAKMHTIAAANPLYDALGYATLLAAALFTVWYPRHAHRNAAG